MIGFGRAPCDEGVIRAGRETGCAERARPWVLATTILGSAMAFIDGSVVNVALPAIQSDLQASIAGAQWVVGLGEIGAEAFRPEPVDDAKGVVVVSVADAEHPHLHR